MISAGIRESGIRAGENREDVIRGYGGSRGVIFLKCLRASLYLKP